MPWVRLDDAVLDNVKILNVGPLGFALHIAGITYCARNLTDGFIPFAKASTLMDFSGVEVDCANPAGLPSHGRPKSMAGKHADVEDIIGALLDENLWELDSARGGYIVHDYLEYNPSRADVLAERAKKSEAGKRGAKTRWNGTSHSKAMAPVMAERVANGRQNDAPVPDPVPSSDLNKNLSPALSCLQGGRGR